ncbi:hypothetical protein Btru_050760 [Bulinus truncatus]|nr:hypothetical protein Btru_050760 [Bulinus truncatus]
MTHFFNSSRDGAEGWPDGHAADGPYIVAMDQRETQRQEAYYLFFVGSLGMALNILVITVIFIRRNLRRMTSAFLIHSGFLNLLKAAFCVPFGLNLLTEADEKNEPPNCRLQGSVYIVLVTTSAINMVAMICTEAYTFGEVNVGGNSHGTSCCILFGLLVVYITSVILHLGPTLIGGAIRYNPDIGSCAFQLGHITGYVANVMWIVIITLSFVGVGHFLGKLYREIQLNRPNRVSMLVRHSISISAAHDHDDDDGGVGGGGGGGGAGLKPSARNVHEMTQEAMHRAKIFVITAIAFVLCWYPLFLLILVDIHFRVSPKVYQAFSFIAWTEAMVEPIILICFDRNLNLLARFMYCDRDQYTATQIAYLMAQNRQRLHLQQQYQHHHHHPPHHHLQHHHHHHHQQHHHQEEDDDEDGGRRAPRSGQSSLDADDDALQCGAPGHYAAECGGCICGAEVEDAHCSADRALCRHCCPTPPGETTLLRPHRQRPHSQGGEAPLSPAVAANERRGFCDFHAPRRTGVEDDIEMNFNPYNRVNADPIARKQMDESSRQGDIQC